MRERTLLTGAVVLVALVVAAPMTATVGGGQSASAAEGVALAPGARAAGVIGVQRAEFEGELAERTLAIRLRKAKTPNATAAVVAELGETLRDRLDQLRERMRHLRAARRAGNISRSEFRARMAELVAEIRTLRRLANETVAVARGLPEAALRAHGVNVTALRTLPERASELAGPEIAEIARSIAGPNVGQRVGRGPPPGVPGANVTTGPPDDGGPENGGPPGNEGAGSGGPPENGGPPDDSDDGNRTTADDGGGRGRSLDGPSSLSDSSRRASILRSDSGTRSLNVERAER